MIDHDQIDQLILDFLQGRPNKSMELELRNWIAESVENKEYFTKTCALWELSALSKSDAVFESQRSWFKISDQINPEPKRIKPYTRWASIAAIFVLAFISSYITMQFLGNKNQAESALVSYIINEAPMGNMSKITLPDGSEIWLNAGSKIKYATSFNQNDRHLSLMGEAYFHVATNKSKPFVVNAQGVEVKATGTRFNVKAYKEEGFIEATLEEGIISVKQLNNKSSKEVLLTPNQKITFYKKTSKISSSSNPDLDENLPDDFAPAPIAIRKIELASNVETPVYTSWKDSSWIIQNEKLEALAIRLGRRYDVSIQLLDDKVRTYSYTGTLKDETLEQVLEVMSQSSPIKYKLDKKKVSLWYNYSFN
ncbi:MAG: FecR domain-containing protein [Prolixibacteraceae bacterium]